MPRKTYVKLIHYVARLDYTDFVGLDKVDAINIRALYLDAVMKHERWRNDVTYHKAVKPYTLTIEINHYATLQKLYNEFQQQGREGYETNALRMISIAVMPQIDAQLLLNQVNI